MNNVILGNSISVAISSTQKQKPNTSIAIGLSARASGDCSIAIGYGANATDNQIILGDVNIRDIVDDIEELKTIVKTQQEMLIALWNHPGMPGYEEAKQHYENIIEGNVEIDI